MQRYEIVAPNIYLDWNFNEMDIMGLRRSGYIDEVEIKLSKSDFGADFKKKVMVMGDEKFSSRGGDYHKYSEILKHDALQKGLPPCNYFSFLMPKSLADKCEIPHYTGLYVYHDTECGRGRIVEIKKAPLLHKRKIDDVKKYEVGRKMAYRYWKAI